MKGMQKIKRGKCFSGIIHYALKSINEMFAKNYFSEAHRLMSQNVYIFVNWWCDNLNFMSVDIPSLIASKEKELIISNAGKLRSGNFDKKRL
ncbi:hypothetical protein [Klebsiella pneumoniae]|uniref:hypothetical protein n=1 Tax=Klebsiella pneumoniae TaxID=573 RepID=UPI0035104CB6